MLPSAGRPLCRWSRCRIDQGVSGRDGHLYADLSVATRTVSRRTALPSMMPKPATLPLRAALGTCCWAPALRWRGLMQLTSRRYLPRSPNGWRTTTSVVECRTGTALGEMIRAAATVLEDEHVDVTSPVFHEALALSDKESRRAEVVSDIDGGHVSIYSRMTSAVAQNDWTLHLPPAKVERSTTQAPERLDLEALRARCIEFVDIEQSYESFAVGSLRSGVLRANERSRRGPSEVSPRCRSPGRRLMVRKVGESTPPSWTLRFTQLSD